MWSEGKISKLKTFLKLRVFGVLNLDAQRIFLAPFKISAHHPWVHGFASSWLDDLMTPDSKKKNLYFFSVGKNIIKNLK